MYGLIINIFVHLFFLFFFILKKKLILKKNKKEQRTNYLDFIMICSYNYRNKKRTMWSSFYCTFIKKEQ